MLSLALGRRLLRVVPVIFVGLWSVQSASALEKVRILIPVRNIDEAFSPFVVAKEKGYFAAEGYDVTLIAVGGSNESAIQVSAGNAEVGAASMVFIIQTFGRWQYCQTARSKRSPSSRVRS